MKVEQGYLLTPASLIKREWKKTQYTHLFTVQVYWVSFRKNSILLNLTFGLEKGRERN